MSRFLLTVAFLFSAPLVFAAATPWTPFELDRGDIIIEGAIADEPVRVLLDSGATTNAISERFIAKHGERIGLKFGSTEYTVSGVATTRKTRPVHDVKLRIFGSVFNMALLIPVRVRHVEVLLGVDFFSHSIVQIDYPNQRLRLIERDSLALKKLKNVRMKRMHYRGSPKIQVTLNGDVKHWIMLDTGAASGLLLTESFVDEHGWLEKYETTDGRVIGVNAVAVKTRQFNLPLLTIGPYTLENVPVTVIPDSQTTLDLGLLGYDVLKHFQLTMDLKKKHLHIEAVERIEP